MKTLVIDVGTSGVRAAILLEDGSLHDLYYESLPPTSVAPGLVEFDAEKMYESVHRVASSAARGHDVTAVGITCQRASTVV
ncbi:MAG: glycerol kinase, partial [Actinomycetota bacterium]